MTKKACVFIETARDSTSENNQMTAYRLTLANRFTTMRDVRQAGIVLFVSLFVGVIVLITTSAV